MSAHSLHCLQAQTRIRSRRTELARLVRRAIQQVYSEEHLGTAAVWYGDRFDANKGRALLEGGWVGGWVGGLASGLLLA